MKYLTFVLTSFLLSFPALADRSHPAVHCLVEPSGGPIQGRNLEIGLDGFEYNRVPLNRPMDFATIVTVALPYSNNRLVHLAASDRVLLMTFAEEMDGLPSSDHCVALTPAFEQTLTANLAILPDDLRSQLSDLAGIVELSASHPATTFTFSVCNEWSNALVSVKVSCELTEEGAFPRNVPNAAPGSTIVQSHPAERPKTTMLHGR